MKQSLFLFAILALISSQATAFDLKKLNCDDTAEITPKIQSDSKIKVEGESSIKITTQWPTTVCLGAVDGLDIENVKLIYRAKVKSNLDGNAFLEMWVQVGGKQYFSRNLNSSLKGTVDWKTIQTPFILQKGHKPEKVTLNLVINGKGTVWIDDIVLAKNALE